jgi:aminoglycoside phosphotransferase (APT) family kinase protein
MRCRATDPWRVLAGRRQGGPASRRERARSDLLGVTVGLAGHRKMDRHKVCPILGAEWERQSAVRCGQKRSDDANSAASKRLTCRNVPDRACCSPVLSVRDEEPASSIGPTLSHGNWISFESLSCLCPSPALRTVEPAGCWGSFHVVTGAFAEPVRHDTGEAFTGTSTRATLARACRVAGLDGQDVRLLRLGENAMFRLAQPIVVRIARTLAFEPDARKEVAVARWLEAEDYPSVRALSVDQPLVIDGRVVTFWEALSDEELYGTTAEVAELLVRLHALTPPSALELQPLRPFARAEWRIEMNSSLAPADRAFLSDCLEKLKDQYAKLRFSLPPGVIHGDASVGNVIHDRDGRPVLIDLDGFAIGPREWDLVLTAMYYDSFGWHTAAEYDAFAEMYGFDVMRWPGYPVLRDVREFLMVTWLSQQAGHDEEVAAEVRKRIVALRTGGSKRDWRPY